jgi:hypothetical protein
MPSPRAVARPNDDPGLLRRILLWLVLLTAGGLLVELLLLEHFEDVWQWVPLVILGVVLLVVPAVFRRATPGPLRLFRALMVLCLVAGGIGVILHVKGNIEWEIEQESGVTGLALFWEALRGATPALAPGAMAQLGLVGLLFTFRHPALRDPSPDGEGRADIA